MHREGSACKGAELGKNTHTPDIPLAKTSHMFTEAAREAGKCSLAVGSRRGDGFGEYLDNLCHNQYEH